MDASDVVAYAANRLKEAFQVPVYVDRLPQDFDRPSFALELQKPELTDLNLGLVRWTAALLITGFGFIGGFAYTAVGTKDKKK